VAVSQAKQQEMIRHILVDIEMPERNSATLFLNFCIFFAVCSDKLVRRICAKCMR